jgi:hypothetical protein
MRFSRATTARTTLAYQQYPALLLRPGRDIETADQGVGRTHHGSIEPKVRR